MVAMVAKEDRDGAFTVPVLESYPDLTAAYLEVIKIPMDLRTIVEERMYIYERIKDLQDDLKRTLENCCTFNGDESDLGQYAMYVENK